MMSLFSTPKSVYYSNILLLFFFSLLASHLLLHGRIDRNVVVSVTGMPKIPFIIAQERERERDKELSYVKDV